MLKTIVLASYIILVGSYATDKEAEDIGEALANASKCERQHALPRGTTSDLIDGVTDNYYGSSEEKILKEYGRAVAEDRTYVPSRYCEGLRDALPLTGD